jgi:hypothetical protein
MANLLHRLQKQQEYHKAGLNFRHVLRMESLTETEINDHGFYLGEPCARGHIIRDQEQHWCYECVLQIQQNLCGVDVNYLHHEYRYRYAKIFSNLNVGELDECWEYTGPKQVSLPSYRSGLRGQRATNVTAHKAIYEAFWGDIGRSSSVTRSCGNKNCYNPLHLVSSWNMRHPPQRLYPCILELDEQKLMVQANLEARGYNTAALIKQFKNTIAHPSEVEEECPEHEP